MSWLELASYWHEIQTSASGGTGTSSPGQVLVNIAGSVAGDAGLTYDAATDALTVGRVLAGGGSVSVPSFAFASDSDTGLYKHDTNTFTATVKTSVAAAFRSGADTQTGFWVRDGIGIGSFAVAPDAYVRRAAAATLQLGAAPNATPVANTLVVGESGSGTDIAGANGVIQSGAGTGSGAGSTLTLKVPLAVGGATDPQTMGSVFIGSRTATVVEVPVNGQIYLKTNGAERWAVNNTASENEFAPHISDAYDLGQPAGMVRSLYLSRATLGSKPKAITDGSATAFATFTIADGATYGGEIIYSVVSTQGTAKQRLDGRARFSATREGAVYTVVVNEVGTQLLAAAAGTLTGAIEISGTAGVVTLSANFNTSQTPNTFVINARFNSTDAGLALTFP